MNHNLSEEARYWIGHLQLQPHPEGGYFAETYRSPEIIQSEALPGRYAGGRSFSTAIYFLVTGDSFSALHRIQSDEMWHFYAGNRLTVTVIDEAGILTEIHLGQNPAAGEVFQAVVKAGCWFGSRVTDPQGYALVGCTVAPGFDFADFSLAGRNELIAQFPEHEAVIRILTR